MIGWEVALTAVITAAVTWSVAQRQITAQHVLTERQKWREEIRAKALLVHDAILCGNSEKLSRLKAELMARLNPLDDEDRDLLACVTRDSGPQAKAEEFAERVALLLKHDWDRAKLEASAHRWVWDKGVKRVPWKRWKCVTDRSEGAQCEGAQWWNGVKAWFVRARWIGRILVVVGFVWGVAALAPLFWNHLTSFWCLVAK